MATNNLYHFKGD